MQTQEVTNQNRSREKWIVRLIAFLTFLAGVINLSWAIQPALAEGCRLIPYAHSCWCCASTYLCKYCPVNEFALRQTSSGVPSAIR